jgi:hypothetical protein
MKNETAPEWPQPLGIFDAGTSFNPIQFLTTIRDLYDKIVTENAGGDDLELEYHAFARMLRDRTTVTRDGHHLFKLYDLRIPFNTPSRLIVEEHGKKYLRVDCLRD